MELLIKRAQNGDNEAFIQAINEYMPQMYKVAKSRLKNEEDIGDAVQETIISAFSSIKRLRQPAFFKTWIIKILINKCNDIFEKNKILHMEDYEIVENTQLTSVCNSNIDEELDFDNILNNLSPEYRLVVVMYYVNRFTTREISEILNEKEGTIKSRLSRARQQLKTYYLNVDNENISVGGSFECI